ncbi:MAG: hypothetical protein ACE5GS_03390 [Kiloniellaceae bacterium]
MTRYGPRIERISERQFRDFAKRFATSPEIGPIRTSLDADAPGEPGVERVLVGLWGCDRLCAVACLHVYEGRADAACQVVKLDSVIADTDLRRRGLAGLLLAQSFKDLVAHGPGNVSRIYAHSVHPATVRLLRRLGFSDPPMVGAPISDIGVETEARDAFLKACEEPIRGRMDQMRLQCELCRNADKRARPWCLPSGESRKF